MVKIYKQDCGCTFEIDEEYLKKRGKSLEYYLSNDMIPPIKLDIRNVNTDCKKVWDLMGKGLTKGVFQLESSLGRHWTKRLKPTSIEHLSALGALLRPGCLHSYDKENDCSLTELYCRRKNEGLPINYLHAALEPILSATFGVLCIEENTLIALSNGTHKTIKEISKGEKVSSLDLSSKIMTNSICDGVSFSKRDVGYKLKLSNNYEVILTKDHKVLTRDGWKELQELDIDNDLIVCPGRLNNENDICELDDRIENIISKEDFCYLAGQIVGNGSISKPKFDILINWLKENSNLNINDINKENRKTLFRFLLDELSLNLSSFKERIPEKIFRSCNIYKTKFLAGLFDSNGYCNKDIRRYTSTNKQLLHDIRQLLLGLGILSYFKKNHLYIFNCQDFDELVTKHCLSKKIDKIIKSDLSLFENDVRYFKIKSIKNVGDCNFYRMSVRKTNNMVANGIIIKNCYQEQAMQIAVDLAGFTLQEADILRKAIGKKLPEEMAKIEKLFISGAKKVNIVNEEEAKEIFSWIEASQRYSFNKSHAVSYAINSYWSAYCKAHFPVQFFTAYLRGAKDKQNPLLEVRELVEEAKLMDIKVLAPRLLSLKPDFFIEDGKSIRFGLSNIKGIGEVQIEKLISAIKNAEKIHGKKIEDFSWYEFLVLVSNKVSVPTIEKLISVGALDDISQ